MDEASALTIHIRCLDFEVYRSVSPWLDRVTDEATCLVDGSNARVLTVNAEAQRRGCQCDMEATAVPNGVRRVEVENLRRLAADARDSIRTLLEGFPCVVVDDHERVPRGDAAYIMYPKAVQRKSADLRGLGDRVLGVLREHNPHGDYEVELLARAAPRDSPARPAEVLEQGNRLQELPMEEATTWPQNAECRISLGAPPSASRGFDPPPAAAAAAPAPLCNDLSQASVIVLSHPDAEAGCLSRHVPLESQLSQASVVAISPPHFDMNFASALYLLTGEQGYSDVEHYMREKGLLEGAQKLFGKRIRKEGRKDL